MAATASREELIETYFNMGLHYKDIITALNMRHSIILTERHLKRILRSKGLFRRKNYSNVGDVINFIRRELDGSGCLHGYRWMYHKLQVNGFKVKKEDVRVMLSILDPDGTENRRAKRLKRRVYFSKGPNFIWHLDSYDKLKPFGICINGCIDGFSRRLIWLHANITSSDPKVVGGYFIQAIQHLQGCPTIVRGDFGTENCYVCNFQRFFREDDDDTYAGERSFMYGSSNHNQRIESFWCFLRKECIEYWLVVFHNLKNDGYFDGSFVDKHLVLFCFLGIIQDELDSTAKVWNTHVIAPCRNSNSPHGRPNVMYFVPELFDSQDYLKDVSKVDLDICADECLFRSSLPCDEDIFSLCTIIMAEQQLDIPHDASTALDLYIELKQALSTLL